MERFTSITYLRNASGHNDQGVIQREALQMFGIMRAAGVPLEFPSLRSFRIEGGVLELSIWKSTPTARYKTEIGGAGRMWRFYA